MSIRTDPAVHVETPRRPLTAWIPPHVGVAAAIVGLLPWLITGMRLPLQNLWATETLPDRMPIVLLPFSQYALTLIAALIVIGAAAAALAVRATRVRRSRRGVIATFIGLLATQVIAVAQTATVVRGGLADRAESELYFAAVLAVAALAILVGTGVFWLIAVARRAGALIGLAIAAIAFGPWLNGLLVPMGTIPADWIGQLAGYTHWVPPILVGVAIAWCGLGTIGRVIAAAASLLLLWTAPALITGVTSAAGSRVMATVPLEMLDYAARVTGMALFLPELALPPMIVAVVVAAAGLAARAIFRRRLSVAAGRLES
ncbi:MAG TPA: hypothetical protein VFM66_01920 [Agromyces sp.]|nr:hypothetical protein [Agromyces sp.]